MNYTSVHVLPIHVRAIVAPARLCHCCPYMPVHVILLHSRCFFIQKFQIENDLIHKTKLLCPNQAKFDAENQASCISLSRQRKI